MRSVEYDRESVKEYAKRLSSYQYQKMRMLHIEGVRKMVKMQKDSLTNIYIEE